MIDKTEEARRALVDKLNSNPGSRESLKEAYGEVWDTSELQRDFTVMAFMAPYVSVVRKSDGVKGLLKFQHMPRFYFFFQPDEEEVPGLKIVAMR